MGSSYASWPALQINRNAPTTSGAPDDGVPPGTSSELTSKLEAIDASPSNEGLGAPGVTGGVAITGGVDGACAPELSCPSAAGFAETLQPVRIANSIIDAASVFKFLVKLEMTPLRV